MTEPQFTYEPGICNIDSVGTRWRKRLAFISLIAGIISMVALYFFHFGMIFRVVIGAGFGFTTAINFLQAKEHFCVTNASRRTYEISLRKIKIKDDQGKEKDLKKMSAMIRKALLYSLLGAKCGLLPF